MTWQRVGWGLVYALSGLIVLLTLAGFFGALAWQLENVAVFRVPLFWSALIGLAIAVAGKRLPLVIALGITTLLNSLAFVPLYVGGDNPVGPPQLRAMLMNVRYGNSEYDRVFQAIRDADPDILLLVEVSHSTGTEIEKLKADYPYALIEPRGDTFGIAYFSKREPTTLELQYFGITRLPSVVATYDIDGAPLTIVGTHPLPPTNDEYVLSRNDQLTAIADYLHGIAGARMLLGDINLTSDSARFHALRERAGLRDSRKGFGIQGSWPCWKHQTLHTPLRIAIDHCLVSEEIQVHTRRLGPNVNSDHYPVVVGLSVGK